MYGRLIYLTLMLSCVLAHAKHGEIDGSEMDSAASCGRRLHNIDQLHNRLTGEPQNPDDPEGFVTDAYPMTVDTMVRAYSKGLYALEESTRRPGHPRLVSPKERGVILLDPNDLDKGISRRDLRTIRQMRSRGYVVRFDTDFAGVVEGCRNQQRVKAARPRSWRQKKEAVVDNPTWITNQFANVFLEMHVLHYAHSVEVYYNNELVAGLFGTFVDGVFTGESMFYVPGIGDNASKLAIYELRRRLGFKGHPMIDSEQTVGLILDMGGVSLPRENFLERRAEHAALDLPF